MENRTQKTILLVEDEAIIALAKSKEINNFGYDVKIAYSGEEAIKVAIEQNNIDLVLMDINLGRGIDGTEAAKQILLHKEIPIVFHTAHTEKEYVDRVKEITRYGYVMKSAGDFVLQSSIEMAFELFEANKIINKQKKDLININEKLMVTIEELTTANKMLMDTQKYLLDREVRYKELFNNIRSGVAIYKVVGDGEDFIFVDLNKAGEISIKEKREDIIGKSVYLVKPGIREMGLDKVFKRVWKTGIPEAYPIKNYKDQKLDSYYENYVYRLPSGEIVAVFDDVTELKISQEKLKESELQKKEILDGISENIIFINENYEILWLNRAAKNYIQKNDSDIIGKKCYEFWQDLARPCDNCPINQGIINKSELKSIIQTSDGKYWEKIIKPIFNTQENFLGIIEISKDITELKENEEKFKFLFENMTQGVVYHDSTGKIIEANKSAADILGLSLEQLYGLTSLDPRWHTIHEDGSDYPGETHPVMITLDTGKPVRNSIMGVFNPIKNSYSWININSIPKFKNGDLKPYQVIVTFEDITELKNIEKAIVEKEKEYKEIFNSTYEAIFIDDASNGKIIDVNDSMLKLYGYDNIDEVLKGNIGDLSANIPPYTEEVAQMYIKKAIEEGPQTFEWLAKRKNNELFWVEVSLKKTEIGGKDRILAVVRDITERKKADNKIRQLLNEKENILKEVHHRIKNNMNTICSILNLQALSSNSIETRNCLTEAKNRVLIMEQIYKKLYLFDNYEKLNFHDYITDLVAKIRESYIYYSNIDIKVNIDQKIEIDGKMAYNIGIIVNELISNSIKYAFRYSEKGLISFTIHKYFDSLEIEYSDNGEGVSKEIINDNNFGGFGIEMIKNIVNIYNGSFEVFSDNGIKIKIKLPI